MSRVLKCFRAKLVDQGIINDVEVGGEVLKAFEVSFVADTMIPLVDCATNIVDKTVKVAVVAVQVFGLYSMVLNFSAGKSEAPRFICGPCS